MATSPGFSCVLIIFGRNSARKASLSSVRIVLGWLSLHPIVLRFGSLTLRMQALYLSLNTTETIDNDTPHLMTLPIYHNSRRLSKVMFIVPV